MVFEKIYECLFVPNCTRKIIWLPVNNRHEKISPCWLMKRFRDGWAEGTHVYHAIREKLRHQLRHPGRALDLKSKYLIGHLWVALSRLSCQSIQFQAFALFRINWQALSQSAWRNFFMYIIIIIIVKKTLWLLYKLKKPFYTRT